MISDNIMFTLCLRLGINAGKDSTERKGISVESCIKQKQGGYLVTGIYSMQSGSFYEDTKIYKLDHVEFEVLL